MRISDFPAGVSTTDESELVLVVQGGLTQKLTIAQLNALRQPFSATLVAIAALTGTGYLYRDGSGTWSFDAGTGGSYDPAGTAAALVAAHDSSSASHSGIVVAFLAHRGVGGVAEHSVATALAAGFAPALSGSANDFVDGTGAYTAPRMYAPTIRIDYGDSPYSAMAGAQVILADATSGAITVSLPAITAAMDGRPVIVKAINATNTITVNCDAADNIDGAADAELTVTNQSMTFIPSYDAGGSYWSIV